MRVTRTRTVEWKLQWREEGTEHIAYLGKWRVGKVARNRRPGSRVYLYGAYVHLPWLVGPLSYEGDVLSAKAVLREKIQEWLGGMSDEIPDQASAGSTRTRRVRSAR